jgi:hypothetical protein
MKKLFALLALAFILALSLNLSGYWDEPAPVDRTDVPTTVTSEGTVQLIFPADRYPETAKHIKDAVKNGHAATCTIDRGGADENRKLSLRGIETKKGFDRDEWPMAMCAEGGEGADIEYISPSDNRGAGSWVGNQLEEYPDGTLVEFIFE